MFRIRFMFFAQCVLLCLATIGCGRTQVSAPNRKLLEALQTAVSSKQSDWLEATSKQLTEKRASGDVSESEFKSMNSIIIRARSGDWKGAQKEVFDLSEGQRPTADDVANVRERKTHKD
jgi:hypothetical protein